MPRARNPMVAIGLAAVVLGLVALAVLVTARDDAAPHVVAQPLPDDPVDQPSAGPENQPQGHRTIAAATAATTASIRTANPGVRVYRTDGGSTVRDHRPGSTGHIPDEIRRPTRRTTMPTATLLAVRGKVMPMLRACAGDNVTERGAAPSLQATLTVSIANEQLTVDAVSVTTKDIIGAAGLVGCIEHDVGALAMAMPGAADVAGHKITLPARLPVN